MKLSSFKNSDEFCRKFGVLQSKIWKGVFKKVEVCDIYFLILPDNVKSVLPKVE